jgi:hypothetical protein
VSSIKEVAKRWYPHVSVPKETGPATLHRYTPPSPSLSSHRSRLGSQRARRHTLVDQRSAPPASMRRTALTLTPRRRRADMVPTAPVRPARTGRRAAACITAYPGGRTWEQERDGERQRAGRHWRSCIAAERARMGMYVGARVANACCWDAPMRRAGGCGGGGAQPRPALRRTRARSRSLSVLALAPRTGRG